LNLNLIACISNIENCLNPDLQDLRIFGIVESDAGKSGKSFNRDNRGSDRREAA